MKFWHRRSKAIQTDTDIVVLTESIKMEQQRLAHLDQLLEDKGAAPVINSDQSLKDKGAASVINPQPKPAVQHCRSDTLSSNDLKMPETR